MASVINTSPNSDAHQPPAAANGRGDAAPASGGVLPGRSDLQLVGRLVAGCEQSWREFVVTYAGLVRSRVARVAATCGAAGDTALVDDLVAEVFSALLANDSATLRAFAGRSTLATYLCVIAARVAIKKSIGSKSLPRTAATAEVIDQRSSEPAAKLIGNEQRVELLQLIEELPAKQRDIVRLFHFEGCSYEQISRQLAIPIGSVGPTLKRAEAKLRSRIES